MPAVIAKVQEIFGQEANKTVNPDEVVAMGAAIQAGVLQGDVKDVLLLDVTPLSLGIETLGGVMTVLIPRNTTIPTSKSETFTTAADNQSSVEVHVVQGERSMANENKSIGRFILDGIAPAPRGVPQIEVTFDIDADGILTVTARDKATSKEQHITITGRSGLSDDEIQEAIRDAEEHADEDQKRREAIEARNAADSAVYSAEKLLREQGENVSSETKEAIEGAVKKVRDLLAEESPDPQQLRSAVDELQQAMQRVGQEVYASAGASGGGTAGEGPSDEGGAGGDDSDDTVEGEFREV